MCTRSLPTRECGLKYACLVFECLRCVTPYAGVWIEILKVFARTLNFDVTPYAGVWIEIFFERLIGDFVQVTPYAGVWIEISEIDRLLEQGVVTPYAGVWIEIHTHICLYQWALVTPYAGVWIEIMCSRQKEKISKSLPTRECGLKCQNLALVRLHLSHSLRGSVD